LKKKQNEDRYWMMRQIGLLTMVPMLLAASPIIGLLIGNYIDKKFGTGPVFTIIFLIIGFVAGARQVANVVRKAQKDDRNKDGPDGV
jgi:ATP synthase protein I